MASVLPPKEAFQIHPTSKIKSDSMAGYEASGWIATICPAEGGMYAHYVDEPYPRSGHMHTDAVDANNIVKKLVIGSIITIASPLFILQILGFLLVPFSIKKRQAERALLHFLRFTDYVNRLYYLQFKYYSDTPRQIWKFAFLFLRHLGFSFDLSYRAGRLAANLFQWEEAYTYRLQDLFSSSLKEFWLKNPRAEINRVMEIYVKREKSLGEGSVGEKFLSAAKILSLILLFPRFKKAFTKSMEEIEYEKLKFRENDRYYVLRRSEYDYMGETIEQRQPRYAKLKNEFNLKRAKAVLTPEAYMNLEKQVLAFERSST